jgi:hypothetical protein
MKHVPEETYQRYAQHLYSGSNNSLNQIVFVSTEDPTALSTLTSNMAPWTVQYTSVLRNNHGGKTVSDGEG